MRISDGGSHISPTPSTEEKADFEVTSRGFSSRLSTSGTLAMTNYRAPSLETRVGDLDDTSANATQRTLLDWRFEHEELGIQKNEFCSFARTWSAIKIVCAGSAFPQDLSPWYWDTNSSAKNGCEWQPGFLSAKSAFKEGIDIFKQKLTKDPKKRYRLEQLQTGSVQDLLDELVAAKQHYEERHGSSQVRQYLSAFSQRVCYYGNIMDVVVQHHPEYVALAWGAMKLLFGAVVEHEKTSSTLLAALCEVGDALPRIELAAILYPTVMMKQAVAMLYAHIIRFLIRALNWYEEGRLSHALHAITRPVAIRYSDLLKAIQRDSESIRSLAAASSQAEQRDIHNETIAIRRQAESAVVDSAQQYQNTTTRLSLLTSLVEQLRDNMAREEALNASARVQIETQLSGIQHVQALQMISSQCAINHKANFDGLAVLRDRRRTPIKPKRPPFWTSPILHAWNTSNTTSSILLRATFRERLSARDFCINAVEQLLQSRTAVMWILGGREQQSYSLQEVLKSLLTQALSLDPMSQTPTQTDLSMSHRLRKLQSAHSDEDYIDLLAGTLQQHRLVYIVVSAESMQPDTALRCRMALRQLASKLSASQDTSTSTLLRVVTTVHGASPQADERVEDRILRIGNLTRRTGGGGGGGGGPSASYAKRHGSDSAAALCHLGNDLSRTRGRGRRS